LRRLPDGVPGEPAGGVGGGGGRVQRGGPLTDRVDDGVRLHAHRLAPPGKPAPALEAHRAPFLSPRRGDFSRPGGAFTRRTSLRPRWCASDVTTRFSPERGGPSRAGGGCAPPR